MKNSNQRYMIQLLQTFSDLAFAHFPLASSSVPQLSAFSIQKVLKLDQEYLRQLQIIS